jgi:two-component system, NtrC family, response regulator GlrR
MPRRVKAQNIVIIEDDADIGQALDVYFNVQNTVQVFASAEEALAAENKLAGTDVFIIDYKLPGKNGVELFHYLKTKIPTAKYILITGEMSYDLAEKTRELGLDALILKPFDFTILEDNISALTTTAAA